MTHWSPDGWVINLGAGWSWGWLHNGQKDRDFLAETQGRITGETFEQVLRAEWIGAVLDMAYSLRAFATDKTAEGVGLLVRATKAMKELEGEDDEGEP